MHVSMSVILSGKVAAFKGQVRVLWPGACAVVTHPSACTAALCRVLLRPPAGLFAPCWFAPWSAACRLKIIAARMCLVCLFGLFGCLLTFDADSAVAYGYASEH